MSFKTDIKANARPSKRRKLSHTSSGSETADRSQNGKEHEDTPEVEDGEEHSEEESDSPTEPVETASHHSHPVSSDSAIYQTMAVSSAGPSIMGMQIHDLLQEVTPNYEVLLKRLQPLVERLCTTLENIPASAAISLSEAEKRLFSAYPFRSLALPEMYSTSSNSSHLKKSSCAGLWLED